MVMTEHTRSYLDKGYAWFVCFASFLGYFLVTMGICTSGILFHEFLVEFERSNIETALIPSLQCSMGALLGIFISPQVRRFGCRAATIFGTILGATGYILCSFSNEIIHLYATLGILVGVGNGFLFFSSAVAVQFYFKRKRALASALSTCGVSVAPFIFAPSIQWLISSYTWRGATLLMGALYLHGLVAAGLMRKPPGVEQELNSIKNHLETHKQYSYSAESVDFKCNIGSSDITYICEEDKCQADKAKGWQVSISIKCSTSLKNFSHYFADIFDLSLLGHWKFSLFVFAASLNIFGHLTTYLFLPEKARRELSLNPNMAAAFIAIIGVATTCGRLLSGLVGDNEFIAKHRFIHYGFPMLLTGISTILAALIQTTWQMYMYSVIFGVFTGVYLVAQQPLLVHILGVSNFPRSFGIMLIFTGSASLLAQPFAGWLVDTSKMLCTPFFTCGSFQAAGGIIAMIAGINKKQHKEDTSEEAL